MQTTGITNLPTQPPSQGLAAGAAVGAAKQESSQPEPQPPKVDSVSKLTRTSFRTVKATKSTTKSVLILGRGP
jgi:hypothetical protein